MPDPRARRLASVSTSSTDAPRSMAASASACPIGPAPRTTTCSPSATRPRTTARTAIETGSISAASAGSWSPTGNTCAAGTSSCSWSAPSRCTPTRLMFDARVAAADPARVAAAARRRPARRRRASRRRGRRDSRARLEDRRGRLVPLDTRVERRRVVDRADVTEEVVEVRPAQADGLRAPRAPRPAPARPAPSTPTTSIDPRSRVTAARIVATRVIESPAGARGASA